MLESQLPPENTSRLLEIGRSLTANLELEPLLHQITAAARELTGAKYAALGVLNSSRDSLERFVTIGIDEAQRSEIGVLPSGRGVLGVLIDDPRPLRLDSISRHPSAYGFPAHHPSMESFLGVPILVDGLAFGNLYLTDKSEGNFDDIDEASVVTLAAWAAIAINNARRIEQDRLRAAIEGAEQERRRWARELHDDTLQGLGALNVLLSSAVRRGDLESLRTAAAAGSEQLRVEISNLRSLIAELRPASLDELGLEAALEALFGRLTSTADFDVELSNELGNGDALPKELEITVYRVIQESINNVAKHASASHIQAQLRRNGSSIELSVHDDGRGFDPGAGTSGFGLVGMQERVALAGGTTTVTSSTTGGTTIQVKLPLPNGAASAATQG
ncbi:MAG: GAF domain-containing sensor histidine kinase [Thermoleophilaceae bacterium]|nr:GAF domain-containing sensor histidine kinase [Thermoleophilaceae bacterium]